VPPEERKLLDDSPRAISLNVSAGQILGGHLVGRTFPNEPCDRSRGFDQSRAPILDQRDPQVLNPRV